ncbi:MAG: AI-2E family transporter [Deferrisomatales bacterium]
MTGSPRPVNPPSALLTAASVVVVVAGIRAAEALVVPFLVAAFLALIGAPPVFWLKRRRVPSVAAVFLVVGSMVAVGLALGAVIGTSLNDFTQALPAYQARLQEEMGALARWLGGWGVSVSAQALLDYVDPGAAMRVVARTLSRVTGVLTNTFLILLTVVFILLEVSSFPHKVRLAVRDPEGTLERFGAVAHSLKTYLTIKTWVSLATGVLAWALLWAVGVDFPVLWAMVAFLLNFVPSLGSILAAVPPVLLGFVQFGVGRALLVAAGYLAINVLMGNAVEPRLMGRGLGLSPLIVFLSLVFWGWALGPVGMLLSVPLTMTLKIALEATEETRWLAVLLDSERSVELAVRARGGGGPES